jgi:hypothetical protein
MGRRTGSTNSNLAHVTVAKIYWIVEKEMWNVAQNSFHEEEQSKVTSSKHAETIIVNETRKL